MPPNGLTTLVKHQLLSGQLLAGQLQVVILTSVRRQRAIGPLPPEGCLYLAVLGVACGTSIATYLFARPTYIRWMELTGAMLRLGLLGMGMGNAGWHLSR